MPTAPDVVLKAMRSSASRRTRNGGQSGLGSSAEVAAGSQYWRNMLPINVPGPTRHSASLSSMLSMFLSQRDAGLNLRHRLNLDGPGRLDHAHGRLECYVDHRCGGEWVSIDGAGPASSHPCLPAGRFSI